MATVTTGLKARLSKVRGLPLLSRISPPSAHQLVKAEIVGFRRAQKASYDCVVACAEQLNHGWSEQDAADWMQAYLNERGLRSHFHQPVAWFGDRSRFKGFKRVADFKPSSRKLEPGDVVVLDIAPIVDGYVGDIGFTFALEPHAELTKARAFLLELRNELPLWFGSSMTTAEIWKRVDERFVAFGYQNCHRKYGYSVLGHRVHKIPFSWLPSAGAISLQGYWAMASRGFYSELLSPWHRGEKLGVWAIEPHVGVREGREFGAKFEEILVVEPHRAYWLSDDVPHLKLPAGLH